MESPVDHQFLAALQAAQGSAHAALLGAELDLDQPENPIARGDEDMKEGAASNIFIVKDGVLIAPPKTHLMLPGITYDVILELAEQHQQPLVVREISEAELRAADEVWMTSSTKEILAITTLDGKPVGTGTPGPYAAQMWQWYQDFKNTVMRKG